jgi:hypothetical protein
VVAEDSDDAQGPDPLHDELEMVVLLVRLLDRNPISGRWPKKLPFASSVTDGRLKLAIGAPYGLSPWVRSIFLILIESKFI